MMYYQVVISGSNIFFEHYGNAEPVVGFVARRLEKAYTEELAIAMAKRDILVDWNHSFNADRRLGLPVLHVESILPFKGWIKPKTQHDYHWFTNDDHKFQVIQELTATPKKWFWQK